MDDAKRYADMLAAIKSKAEKRAAASTLDFVSLEALVKLGPAVGIIVAVTAVVSVVICCLLFRQSAQKRYQKLRKTFFLPQNWFGLASGLCTWQSLNAITLIIIFLKLSTSSPIGIRAVMEDYVSWGIFASETLCVIGFAVSMAFQIDLGYGILASMFSMALSFFQAASMSDNLAIAGYLGLVNVLFAMYWCCGIGKGWLKTEMTQAMKEIEGWGVSKETTSAITGNKPRRATGPVKRSVPGKK